MPDLSPQDFAFADMAVRRGLITQAEMMEVIRGLDNRSIQGLREGEALGPFLVRCGRMTVEQLYDATLALPASEVTEPFTDRRRQHWDQAYGVVISGLDEGETRREAARILAELRDISFEQALAMCRFPIAPVLTRLEREEAELARQRFELANISCRLVKWKRQSAPVSRSRRGPASGRHPISGRFRRPDSGRSSGEDSAATREPGRRPSQALAPTSMNANAPNPFAAPIPEAVPEPETSGSLGDSSVDFLVVGAGHESDVIFLDGPADENTATAITVFNSSALEVPGDSLFGLPQHEAPEESSARDTRRLGVGATVGGYALQRLLGKGGFARVYLGEHARQGHRAAVKVYKTRDSKLLSRITRREATLIKRLRHPRLVSILNIGQEAGSFFIVMEYVAGESIAQHVKEHGPMSVERIVRVGSDVAEALRYIHRNGLVHRDVKPSNILMDEAGRARLLDFELVKSFTDASPDEDITQSGQLVGTPRFMSPEQIDDARSVGPASDIYSLGATLYYMATGRYPFQGKSLIQIVKNVLLRDAEPPTSYAPFLPEAFERLLLDMLARDAEQRPVSMEAVLELLQAVPLDHDRPSPWPMLTVQADGDSTARSETVADTRVLKRAGLRLDDDASSAPGAAEVEGESVTYISSELQVGKVDNGTVILAAELDDDTEDEALVHLREWEALTNQSASRREAFLDELGEAAARELPPAWEWRARRRARKSFDEARKRLRRRDDLGALEPLHQVMDALPEHRDAARLLSQLNAAPEVDPATLRKLARSEEPQLYEGLQALIEAHAEPEAIDVLLAEEDEEDLGSLLEGRRTAPWLHELLDQLFEPAALRELARSRGLEVSRRASKRRVIARLLSSLGFRLDRAPR